MERRERSRTSGIEATDATESPQEVLSARTVRSIVLFAVAGALLYVGATMASNWQATLHALVTFPLTRLTLVLVLVVGGWGMRGWRFHYYLQKSDSPVPFWYAVETFLAGFALTGTPGKLGEAVKGVFLKQDYGVPVTRVVGIVMMERLMDLWGVLLLGSVSLLLFGSGQRLFLACAAVVLFGGVFLCMEQVYRPVLQRMGRLPGLGWITTRVLGILVTGRELMTPRIFMVGLGVSTIAWAMESLSLFVIFQSLGLPVTMLEANFIYCVSTLVGALSMLPGGIGSAEASMIGLLDFLGISYGAGLPAVILIRLCTLWFAVLVGLCFMVRLTLRSRTR